MRAIEDMRGKLIDDHARHERSGQLRRELELQREAWAYFDEAMTSKDVDIKRLREVAFCAALFLQAVSEYNERLSEEKALGAAMAYGKEAEQLAEALEAL